MKPILAYVWQRRWCRIGILVLAVCALAFSHPYLRQSVFGPAIDGIPWCVWENDFRIGANPQSQGDWLFRMMRKIGVVNQRDLGLPPCNAAGLPLYLHLAEDRDVKVRQIALEQFYRMPKEHETEILPVLRHHLNDVDPECRLIAAEAIWRATKDREMKHVALPMLNHKDFPVRRWALVVLDAMANDDPEVFEPLAKMAEDPDFQMRSGAAAAMKHFGKRGVPILERALGDSHASVRFTALSAAAKLGKDAEKLTPILQMLQSDPDPNIRRAVKDTLEKINPLSK
jgi:hypothetical protein